MQRRIDRLGVRRPITASVVLAALLLACACNHPRAPEAEDAAPMQPLDAGSEDAGEAAVADAGAVDDANDADDAAAEASEPTADAGPELPPEPACDALGHDVSFKLDVPLPWAADRDGLILTSTIVGAFHAGRHELYVSEPQLRQISVLRGCDPYCEVSVLSAGLVAPLRATPVDFDADGDRDVLVADIGLVQARVDLVGRVVLLVNEGRAGFRARVLLDNVGRVACAEPADLDADGDLDVTVCEFGAKDGSVGWLERTAQGGFARHVLRAEAGAIHAFPFDADADGDLDIAVALSQNAQAVLLYRNQGGGQFTEERVFAGPNANLGLTGIELVDLDRDGDVDILASAGDYLDDSFDFAQHGVYLLENDGQGQFGARKLAEAPGLQSLKAVDLDRDCDLDLVLAQLIVPELVPDALKAQPSLVWLENDGRSQFAAHAVTQGPDRVAAIAALNIGGTPSVFAGSFSLTPATSRQERLARFRAE
jgi:hypothetical protein